MGRSRLPFVYFRQGSPDFYYFKSMNKKRVLLHVVFWLLLYCIGLYNELYLSISFSLHPSAGLFLQSVAAVFILLLVKLSATYYILYSLIPRWIRQPGRFALYLEAAVIIFSATFCLRIALHTVIWPLIYREPAPAFTLLQLTARYFYSLLDLLQVAGIASAIKLFRLRLRAIEHEKKLVQEKLRSEILHLKAQLNPHFLFNAINSIYALARSRSELTADAVMRLSKILRYVLYDTEQKTIPVAEELKTIRDYIELQQLRFGKRLTVRLEEDLDDARSAIAPMLLLPLVENAYKHGSEEGGTIHIKATLKKARFSFVITNPVGDTAFRKNGEEGIGLANIKRQLELMYRSFKLDTGAQEQLFKVELNIDLAAYAGIELFDHRG